MDTIKGLPKLAYDMDYDIRNGCVFDPKIFEKYLVSGSYKVQAGYRGGQTAIHLNPGSYIEIPVEWTNVNGWFTLAMWVYIVDDNDDSHYSVMSFNTNNGWKHIYYYPWQQTGFANGNRITNKGSGIYGQWGWRRLNVEINPTNGLIYWICVGFTHQGYLKFVADRNIQNNITWTTLDDAGYTTTEGVVTEIDGRDSFRVRLPGTISGHICDANHYGEWDGIITLFDKGIKPSDPSIWNHENTISWTMTAFYDDPVNYIVGRGMQNMQGNLQSGIAQRKLAKDLCNDTTGFRPVMYYETAPSKFFAVFESKQNGVGYDVFDPLRW